MERVLTADVRNHIGETINLRGWVHRIRGMKGFSFLILRDRAGLIQVIVDEGVRPASEIDVEAAVSVTGTVKADERAKAGAEVQAASVEILSPALDRPPIELNKRDHEVNAAIDVILEHRAVCLRNLRLRAPFTVQAHIVNAFRDQLWADGFIEIHTPKIVSQGTEGGTSLFRMKYFEQDAYLAQSPQFYKQMMVGSGYERVYEVGFVYRAEEHNTVRHLNEYLSLDFEMGFIDSFVDIMKQEERVIRAILGRIADNCAEELEMFGVSLPVIPEGGIPIVRLAEGKEAIASKYGWQKEGGGHDLDPEGERLISRWAADEYGSDFVFLTHYPVSVRPMYTMPDPDAPELTLSFDLLMRGTEITTGGQRIHDYNMFVENMRRFGQDPDNYGFYLEVFKYGMPPHGGLGLGAERITMQLLGLSNVREASLFPRDRTRVSP